MGRRTDYLRCSEESFCRVLLDFPRPHLVRPRLADFQKVHSVENRDRMCTEPVPPHGVVKLTVAGNLGRGSNTANINSLINATELPCENGLVLPGEIRDRNEVAWDALHKGMIDSALRALAPELREAGFAAGLEDALCAPGGGRLSPLPKDSTCPQAWRNVRDLVYSDWRRDFFVGGQVHVQSKKAEQVRLPRHFDGGRGLLCLCARVFGDPTLRVWEADGTYQDMPGISSSAARGDLLRGGRHHNSPKFWCGQNFAPSPPGIFWV